MELFEREKVSHKSFTCHDSLWQSFQVRCRDQGIGSSQVIRYLLTRYLEEGMQLALFSDNPTPKKKLADVIG